MYKTIVSVFCGCLLTLSVHAQFASIDSVLVQVEQHNHELRALREMAEARILELKSTNNLPDPVVEAFYFPFGDHTSGDYTEFQISQSLEFPSVYGARSKLISQQMDHLAFDYQEKRQDVLADAKDLCNTLVYLHKRLETESGRLEQARRVHDQISELHDSGQVGILDLNKAKVVWMQEQHKLQQLESDLKSTQRLLININGGQDIAFEGGAYEGAVTLPDLDTLWNEKLVIDPALVKLNHQEAIARRSLELTKAQSLPNLTAGYNRQGVSGAYYSGIYAGITIPLWSNQNKVKAAQSQINFQQSNTHARTAVLYGEFEKAYREYQIRSLEFNNYTTTLGALDSEALLLEAYQLGEMAYLEYYIELKFYKDAYDTMLQMEYELYLAKNKLLQHQL